MTTPVAEALLALSKPIAVERLPALLRPHLDGPAPRPLLLYLHVPFCTSKCTFCNWVGDIPVADVRAKATVRGAYVTALCTQIRALGPVLGELGYRPAHVYWGGGTPSILSGDEIGMVVGALGDAFDLSALDEHAIETSPETLTPEKLQAMRRLGVNRISMGVQSFDDGELRRAGRAHSAAMAVDAVHMIHDAGFDKVNIDLIVGFPGQSLDVVRRNVDRTLALGTSHVTVYVYRPESNTVMAKQIRQGHRSARTLDENTEVYDYAGSALRQAGYTEYAVGYFARTERDRFKGEEYYYALDGDYVGFGCGADSILGHHAISNRFTGLQRFLARPTEFTSHERFSPAQLGPVLRALRFTILTDRGIVFRNVERLFGIPFSVVRNDSHVKGLLKYLAHCGAEFVERDDRLLVTDESRSRSYIVSLQRAFYDNPRPLPA